LLRVYQKRVSFGTAFGVEFRSKNKCVEKGPFYGTLCAVEVSMKSTTVALYARVSTKDRGQDTENQLLQLREFAEKLGWRIGAEYVDRASGKHSDRAEFQKMFAAASRREFDVLLFWSLDRLSREGVGETLGHLKRLDGYGITFRSFTEQYLDSTGVFRDAVIGILATIAKQERIRLSERTLAGLAKARAKGNIGGRPKAEDNPILMRRYQKLRDAGKSVRVIAAELEISPTTVQKLAAVA
jgi:DNA invertase Pin-like site-specific DNA recombinase